MTPTPLRLAARDALALTELPAKLSAVAALDLAAPCGAELVLTPPAPLPGRPARPELIPPSQLAQRGLGTREGRAALIHALAHIELNAIDLALDIVWRFAGLPDAFYRDWLGVAQEEAEHFQLLNAHLNTLGHQYGDFPAHNGLWDMAERTADDLLARLALVPRTLEARGLDVSPGIQAKLRQVGDLDAVAILDVILRDEIGHVALGVRWFAEFCAARSLEPVAHAEALRLAYRAPRPRGPFNLAARRQAGFADAELAALDAR